MKGGCERRLWRTGVKDGWEGRLGRTAGEDGWEGYAAASVAGSECIPRQQVGLWVSHEQSEGAFSDYST